MITIDLITGFLGSGKTTFLKLYAKWLIENGHNICILENDYGPINVDMMALYNLRSDNCEIEMVSGGADLDCHRRRFKTKLIQMAMTGYDHVIVEPSGIYDTDEFFDALCEEPLNKWYKAGSVICVVDTGLTPDLSRESRYILMAEAANCGLILMSKSQLYDENAAKNPISIINNAMEEFSCNRRIKAEVLTKDWSMLTDADFKRISTCGYKYGDHIKLSVMDNNNFESTFFMNEGINITSDDLVSRAKRLLTEPAFGHVIRVKGSLATPDGTFTEINFTKTDSEVAIKGTGEDILIVIGENIDKDAIRTLIKGG